MKRIQYSGYGGPEKMHLAEYDLPAVAKNEIRVSVRAASINPIDWKVRQGKMKFMTGWRFPRAMGLDFAGVVVGVGSEVTRFRVGDEVLGTTPMKSAGAFAQELITKEKFAVKKPTALSFEAAATLPGVGVTAWRALVLGGHLRQGQRVFINGAFGGVGQAAVNIAKSFGASVTGRVGPKVLTEAAAFGIDAVLDYTKPIPAELDHTFDVVLDCNGSLASEEEDRLAKPGGTVLDVNPTGKKIIKSLLSRRHKFVMFSPSVEILEKIADIGAAGKFNITIGRTALLEESIAMIAGLENGQRVQGKAVILVT